MIQKENVEHVDIRLYGKQLIDNLEDTDFRDDVQVEIPVSFKFNSSWRVEHACLSCGNSVTIDQNYDQPLPNFSVLKNVDSLNYRSAFLKEMVTLFDSIELVKLDDVFYLNRTDFEYSFDFQRKSSVDITYYRCGSCEADYLGMIRVGSPLHPEKGLEMGRVGQVEVANIVMIKTANGLNEYLATNEKKQD